IDPADAGAGHPSHPAISWNHPRASDAAETVTAERWSHHTGRAARPILADALTAMLDAAVCAALLRSLPSPTRRLPPPATTAPEKAAHAWIAALGAADPTIRAEPAALSVLERHVREWLAPSDPAGAESAFRTLFRLTTPEASASDDR